MEDAPSFKCSVILPDGLGSLQLDSIPTLDTCVTLRQLLSEHPLTCCFTSFRMELEWPLPAGGTEAEAALLGLPTVNVGAVVAAAASGSGLKRVVQVK